MIEVHNFGRGNLPLSENLEIAGTHWIVATNSDAVLRGLHRWKVASRRQKCFALRVLVDERIPPAKGIPPLYRGMDHIVFASFGSGFFALDLMRKEITAVISSHTASDEQFWNRVMLPIAVGVMGCFIGVVPLHSACLEWNGVGVLIAGVSGAGKSTLAGALAKLGFSFLSDDWTYLLPEDARLIAYGLGVPLKLLPDAARFFDGLHNHQLGHSLNGELAYEVDPVHFAPRTIMSSVPRYLFMLERRASGPSRFQRIAPDVVHDFFEQSSEPFPEALNHGGEFRSLILNQVANLQCWQFSYSGSPHDAAACIRNFIEQ